MRTLDRSRLEHQIKLEEERFSREHPRSKQLFEGARRHWQGGVPMLWMVRWAGNFPVFVTQAQGAHFQCVDGYDYIDFCLGDTGAMTGHASRVCVEAIARQASRGLTFMLPVEDLLWVGEGEEALTYGDVHHRDEVEFSKYNFEVADIPSDRKSVV